MIRLCFTTFLLVILFALPSRASECLALAQNLARVQPASFQVTALKADEVKISYVGHSTFRIETPEGVIAATDYAGNAGAGPMPTLVTMNRAHSSHFTAFPDPAIQHVFRGWSEDGSPAKIETQVGDMRIRNVTTDIRNSFTTRITDGNSIFIFEVGNLCIGHLGHLHHELTPGHIGWIGRLDVVMVPVDGRVTMPHANMMGVLKDVKASVIIPMHFFGPVTLGEFLDEARKNFKVERLAEPEIVISWKTLPTEPTVMVMGGY
jgi:L-ascorbate metabolism protein UlaG (beta-lactamase superfamily)